MSTPLGPSDWPAFRAQAHRMLNDIVDYLESICASAPPGSLEFVGYDPKGGDE